MSFATAAPLLMCSGFLLTEVVNLIPSGFYIARGFLQIAGASVIGGATLAIPVYDKSLPPNSLGTLMTTVMSSLSAVRNVSLILQSKRTSDGFLQRFWNYAKEFLWVQFPISRLASPSPLRTNCKHAVEGLLVAALKYLAQPYVTSYLLTLTTSAEWLHGAELLTYLQVCGLWVAQVFAGTYMFDVGSALLPLLSMGRFSMLEFNNYPLLSTSLSEFWSRRYNRLVSALLRDSVFRPLRETYGQVVTPAMAVLATFLVSGLIHAYIAYFSFGPHTLLPSGAFFCLHGLAVLAEKRITTQLPALDHPVVKTIYCYAVFALTWSLYPANFINAMPEMLQRE